MFHFYMIINFSLPLTISVRYIRVIVKVIAQKFASTNFLIILISNLELIKSINFSQIFSLTIKVSKCFFFGNGFRNVNDIK